MVVVVGVVVVVEVADVKVDAFVRSSSLNDVFRKLEKPLPRPSGNSL